MGKVILVLCSLLSVLVIMDALVYNEGIFKFADEPGKCVIFNDVLSPGESIKYPGGEESLQCAKFTCLNAEGYGQIEICDPPRHPDYSKNKTYNSNNYGYCKHEREIDASKPFPDCCIDTVNCIV